MRSMSKSERESLVAQTIHSLPVGAGLALKTLNPEIPFHFQARPCESCGAPFTPKDAGQGLGRFCGRSCSAKWRMNQPEHKAKVHTEATHAKIGQARARWLRSGEPKAEAEIARITALNPMSDPDVRRKVSRTLTAMNHGPSVRGGNGRGLTRPQRLLMDVLGSDWTAEYALSLGQRTPGFPTHYKLDLANPRLKVGIEVDGPSHWSRKDQDRKKGAKLASLGWKVLRFWNQEILDWIDSGMPMESSISTILKQNGILPSA